MILCLQFDLSPGQVGLVFLMLSGTYAIVSPFLGWAADKLVHDIFSTINYQHNRKIILVKNSRVFRDTLS